MINLDSITNKNNKENNENWPYIPDHPYRILIMGGSGSEKTNTLLNLIKEQVDIDKIYLYPKDLSESKYEFFVKKRKDVGIKHLNDLNAFTECSNMMDDVYENTDDYKPNRKGTILIVFYDTIVEIMSNKKSHAIIKELFIRCRKLNISLVFITQSYFSVSKDVRLNQTHYLIMKINNMKEFTKYCHQSFGRYSLHRFYEVYRECRRKPNSFLTIDTTLPVIDPLKFRKSFFSAYKDDSN